MGNTNSTGDKENAAVDNQQKGEAAGNANGVKEENNIIPEGESKEYYEKAAALPTYNTSTHKEPQLQNSEDEKTDEDKRETQLKQPFQCSEVQTGANDSVSEVTDIETHTSRYGQKLDQPLESILEGKDEVHDQTCNKKGEAERSLSHDEVLKSDPLESPSVATETVEEQFISSSLEEQETSEKGSSSQNEEKTQLITEIAPADKTVVADANDQNVTIQQDECLAGELAASGDMSNEENPEVMSAEIQVENGYSIRDFLDETPKVESSQSDAAGSLLADSPQITPSNSLAAVHDPEKKCMVHTPETQLISNESENAAKKCDPKETESIMQAVHEMQIESHPIEATEEKLPGNNTTTDSVMDYSIEQDKARRNINVQPDILHYDHTPPVEQHVNFEEVFEMVPEIGLLPTKFIGAATNLEEESSKENGLLEKAKEGVENPSRKEIMEEHILHLGSSEPENGVDIAYADGRMQEFESVEDHKECNADLTELNICAETKNAQDVQPSLEALAFPNGKCGFDQMVPKSIGRLSLESIPEKSSNGIELRKSPSFDFGVNRRSSESDQTPLLCPEKTPTRSLSVGSNAKFSNSIMRTEYNCSSIDYEAVAVEEKTIRMERSDSDISKAPLLGSSNKGENSNLKVTSETQQNHVADMIGEDLQDSHEKETSLTSPKESRKRKPRPSFFTICICCTAATHY
ncbi:hypothetical protein K7X08_005711 [Anisodus acutangulus]|uniref:Uncharacterized protein n=1 Tax=Anisodus acutangulus TaxID=402998 RepID=A0A9Q1LV32_9SOLA|nr:hypothetical protein K7X08_005711 [Anisodus acutangulus]